MKNWYDMENTPSDNKAVRIIVLELEAYGKHLRMDYERTKHIEALDIQIFLNKLEHLKRLMQVETFKGD